MRLIVGGIGTDVGKTVVSAMLCEAFGLDYWKPIQAGDLHNTDSDTVRSLTTGCRVHDESHRLTEAMSPHAAARRDAAEIDLASIQPPETKNLVVELAGGLMVPINAKELTVDLVAQLDMPVVLVANYYLGSINHTLLSIELLKSRGIELVGVVFNGTVNVDSRAVILSYTGIEPLADIEQMSTLTRDFIKTHANQLRQHPRLARFRS